MSFFKDISITGAANYLVAFIAVINNIIVTRQIGPDGRGKYSIISNSIVLLALLFGEGIRKINTILINKSENVNVLITQSVIYLIILTAVFTILFLFRETWHYFLPNINTELLILALIISILTISWQSIQALFLGLQKYYQYNLLLLAPISLTFLLNLIVIFIFNLGLTAIIINLLIGAAITTLIGIFSFDFKLALNFNNREIRRQSFQLIFKSTFSAFQLFLILRADIFLVNYYMGAFWAGIYSIAFFFSEALQKISNVAGTLLISKTVSNSFEISTLYTVKLIRVVLFINFITVIIIGLLGRFIIILFFGNEFALAYETLLFLLPALLSFGPGSIAYSFFVGRSFPRTVLYFTGIAGIANILLNILFIPKYGILASAAISSFTYFFWTISHIIYFRKKSKISYSDILLIKKNDFKYFLDILPIKAK